MSQKGSIDPQERGFYFSKTGESKFDGTSYERPKPTMQEAINATQLLDPPPAGNALAVVSSAQGGSFPTGFTLFDFVQFNGQNVSITEDTVVAVEMASFLGCNLTSVSNAQAASTVFNIDSQSFVSLECGLINVFGTGGAKALNITGSCDNLFVEFKQVTLIADDSIGINITATSPTPIDINIDTVSMDGANSTFMIYDPVNLSDICICSVSSIVKNSVIGTTGYVIKNGSLEIEINHLQCDIALSVETGATCSIISQRVIGDIIVSVNSVLNCFILEHDSGAIINNGTINGIIGGQYFGTYEQKPFQERVILGESFNIQSPTGKDLPLQLEFGPAQFEPSDPVQIDALGNLKFNQSDQYVISITLQYGRIGAGAFSLLFFRVLIDGVQAGRSHSAKLDNANSNFPVEFTVPSNIISGQTLTVEMWRDDTGFDAGSLFPETPTLAGANKTPSAVIRISRSRLTPIPQVVIFDYTVLLNETGVKVNAAGFVTSWDNAGDNQFDLTTVIGSTTSLVLHQSGTALFYGAVNDYISTPDSPANRITNDIDIRVLGVTAVNWSPVLNETLVSKFDISGEFAYVFRIGVGGNLELLLSDNGSIGVLGASTVPTEFIIGTKHSLRVTWRNLTNVTRFFTSEDGIVWTQLGGDVFLPRTGIFPSLSSVEIGSREGGTSDRFRGSIERLEIFRGIDSILEVNFDARNGGYSTGRTGDTFASSTTGEIYQMHGDTFIQNSGLPIINSIGGAALTPSLGVTLAVQMTIFFVAKTHQLTGIPQFFTAGLSNASENPTTEITADNRFVFNGGVSRLNAGPADTNLHLHIIRHNGDDTSSYEVDGVGIDTGDPGAEDWDYATILAELGGIFTVGGAMGELVIYNRGLTNFEVGVVKSALKSKWKGLEEGLLN